MHSSIQLKEVRWSLGCLEPLLLSGTRPPLSSASRELTDAKGAGYLLLKCHTDEHWSTESGFFTTRWSLRKGNWILSKTANYKMIWFFFFFFNVELPAEGCSTRWEGVDTLFAVLAKQSYSFRHYRHSTQPNSFRGRNCGGQARAAVPAPPKAVQIALHSHILLWEQPLTLPHLEIFWYQLQQLSGMMFQCHTWFKENFQPYFST